MRSSDSFSDLSCSSILEDFFWNLLEEKVKKYGLGLDARVVLNNHYHLMVGVNEGGFISKFIGEVHGASSHFIRENLPDLIVNED